MKKRILALLLAAVLTVLPFAGLTVSAADEPDAYPEIGAVRFYRMEFWWDLDHWGAAMEHLNTYGTVTDGVLSEPAVGLQTDDEADVKATDQLIFTFDRTAIVREMTLTVAEGTEFPERYAVFFRTPGYISETYGFTGNPEPQGNPHAGSQDQMTDGFFPEENAPAFTETDRSGNTVTVRFDQPAVCIALMIATDEIDLNMTVTEARFYGAERGDVNGDGAINASDATRVLLAAVDKITLSEDEIAAADFNGDGKVNAADAMKILRESVEG